MDTSNRSNKSATRVTFNFQDTCHSSDSDSINEDDLFRIEEGRKGASRTDELDRSDRSQSSLGASFSSHLRMSRRNLNVDEDILHRAAADAGLGSMGTVYVEVWTLTADGTHLVRPDGGYWMDPVFHNAEAECGCCGTLKCSACKISDPDHPKFIPADPVAPGVGLAGVLWSESATVEDTAVAGGILKDTSRTRKVVWRDIRAMANDPHLPYDERLKAIADAGLGWAAGVPFHVNNHKGIVIYVARQSVDHALLRQAGNEEYLLCAADLIGSAWALRGPRREALRSRKALRDAAIRRVRIKLICLIRMGAKFDRPIQNVDPNLKSSGTKPEWKDDSNKAAPMCSLLKARVDQASKAVVNVAKKCKGTNNRPPPPFSNDQAFFTFVGSFVVLVLLAGIAHSMLSNFGSDYLLLMPPFGALICLQFGLTQAPAAQPRSCLLAQLLSGSIALSISLIPFAPVWLKQAFATALAIGVMTRVGVTHPPAGAAAYLFASGNFGITHFVLLLAGNVVAIIMGSVINNMNEKRQYPVYYAMGLNPKDMIAYLKQP